MAPLRNMPTNSVATRLVAAKQIFRKAGDAFNEAAKLALIRPNILTRYGKRSMPISKQVNSRSAWSCLMTI